MRKTRTRQFQTLLSLVSAGVIAAGTSSSLMAQSPVGFEDEIYELSAFEITGGFAGSLAAAAVEKRAQPVIVEAIAAEDFGKLPDTSIAESLARLPGLTSQRVNSRAQGIVIRGFVGDFSTGLLNGRQQVSTGGSRGVEFDQYPAELLTGVVVYKTGNASLIGQGLAGTIDMRTIKPLSLGKTLLAANVFYEWSDLGKLNPDADTSGLRYSLTYADQFLDGKLGIAFGYSKTNQPGQGEQWNAWGYPDTNNGEIVLGGAKPFVRSSKLDRDSILGVLEYRPNSSIHSTIDLFVSKFEEDQILRGIEFPFWWGMSQLQPGYTVDRGLVTDGQWGNIFGVMRNDIVWREADVSGGGWNTKFGDGTGWVIETDISFSKAERRDQVLETYSGYGSNGVGTADTMRVQMRGGRGAIFTPTLDYANANAIMLASPQGWGGDVVPGGQVGFFKGPRTGDHLYQFRVNAKRDFSGFFSNVETGLAWSRRSKWEREIGPGGTEGWFLALPNGATTAPLPKVIGTADLSFIGIPKQVAYDARKLYNSGYYDLISNQNPSLRANNWGVAEKVLTYYIQSTMVTEVGGMPLTGNLGAQVIRTDQDSSGIAVTGDIASEVKGEHDYIDFVPSLNLILEVGEGKIVRASAARQMARQPMFDMRAGSTYGFNPALASSTDVTQSPWSGSGGNPWLEPWRSNSFDLTYENYFKDGMGYWAINGFYKSLVSYTYNENFLFDFTGYPTNQPANIVPAIYQGIMNIPLNGDGGNMRGMEFTLSLPGEKFSEHLEGFGIIVSGSYTQSSIKPNGNQGGESQPLPGLSDKVVNGTLYYEKAGFAARVSARYRSEYRGDIATFGPRGAVFRNLQAETVVDAQVSYTFQDGPMKNLTIILQGYNLTDEPLMATQGDTDSRLVQDYQRWGSQYSLGLSWKF